MKKTEKTTNFAKYSNNLKMHVLLGSFNNLKIAVCVLYHRHATIPFLHLGGFQLQQFPSIILQSMENLVCLSIWVCACFKYWQIFRRDSLILSVVAKRKLKSFSRPWLWKCRTFRTYLSVSAAALKKVLQKRKWRFHIIWTHLDRSIDHIFHLLWNVSLSS